MKQYLNVLDSVVSGYNNTVHSSHKMKPASVNIFNQAKVFNRLYPNYYRDFEQRKGRRHVRYLLSVGTHVRMAILRKSAFYKGYKGIFGGAPTSEIFCNPVLSSFERVLCVCLVLSPCFYAFCFCLAALVALVSLLPLGSYTDEVFIISRVIPSSPPTYTLKTLQGEDVSGSFYSEELILVKKED